MNCVAMTGRLTRDPELRTTNTGKSVASFSIAVQKRMKPTDGSHDAFFFRCTVWGHGADFLCNYGGKGRLVGLTVRLETRKYTTTDGQEKEIHEIVADDVQLLDRPAEGDNNGSGQQRQQQQPSGGYGGGQQSRQPSPPPDEFDPFADQ